MAKAKSTKTNSKKEKVVAEKVEEIKEEKIEKKEVVEEVKKEEPNTLKSVIELIGIIIAIVVILVFFPNTVVWNIVVLLLMLSFLIFVHEFGHFIIGRLCGVHVYEFALGMGPRLLFFKRKNDPTEYSLRALPIGGYCQLAGEEGEDDATLPKDKFMCNKSKLQRILILVAGVTMNFITAIVLLFIIAFIWGSADQSNIIRSVEENSPASEAGIVIGDRIVELNGHKVNDWDKINVVMVLKDDDGIYDYTIKHENGKTDKYQIKPAEYVVVGEEYIRVTEEHTLDDIIKEKKLKKDEVQTTKIIGIGKDGTIYRGFMPSLKYAFKKFVSIVDVMLLTIGSLFTGKLGLNSLSGPVGMYSVVGTVATYGIANILYLMAYLSVNLGVINILPFPAFDGGRVLFVIIEAITGKKVKPEVENIIHTIGFILLMMLMLYITFLDIGKLF